MNGPSRPGDLSPTSVLDLIKYRLEVLMDAIIANRPFDALCAAARFRTVLEHVEHIVRALPDDRRVSALSCLDHVRSIAAPILALASAPARADLRTLRGSAPDAGCWCVVDATSDEVRDEDPETSTPILSDGLSAH